MNIENFSKMRALVTAHGSSTLVDHFLEGEQGDSIRESLKLKRLQFDTSTVLYNKVEEVCGLLNCSKREFLDMAVNEALDKAEASFFATYQEVTGRDFCDDHAPVKGV